MDATQWQSQVDVIVFDAQNNRILIEQSYQMWRIPRLPIAQLWLVPLQTINQLVLETYGVVSTILQLLRQDIDQTSQTVKSLRVLEVHEQQSALPRNCRWLAVADVDAALFINPEHYAAAQAFFAALATPELPLQPVAWACLGWYQPWAIWLRQTLIDLGYHLTGPIEQVKTSNLSFVARIASDQGWIYCKTALQTRLMLAESRVLATLASYLPKHVPSPILAPHAPEYMLLADLGPDLAPNTSVETRADVLASFARIQQAALGFIEQLAALGWVRRDLAVLSASIDPFAADPLVVAALGTELHARFVAQIARLQARCEQLQTYTIPTTLCHGDLHLRNVAKQSNGYCFFDWAGAALSHPFFDLQDVFHEPDPSIKCQLRDVYLAQWLEYEPIERLEALFEQIEPLYALHQALTYQALLHGLAPTARVEFAWALPFWVNHVLAGLE
ncbi:aminoglycoside phosphotransferase family protein [Herpetosiphon llansteffanensis]